MVTEQIPTLDHSAGALNLQVQTSARNSERSHYFRICPTFLWPPYPPKKPPGRMRRQTPSLAVGSLLYRSDGRPICYMKTQSSG